MQQKLQRTFKYLWILVVYLCFVLGISIGIETQFGKPKISSSSNGKVSGEFGFELLRNITLEKHPYNSDANLRVRQFLLEQSRQIAADSQCNYLFQVSDQDDIKLYHRRYKMYYESNNIFIKITGNRPEALLISAHFDSTENSHGATDDGIAVASILTVLKSLGYSVCEKKPEYTIIFILNNGEELGMLGASAFLYHPWFKDIKGFINLEGTGVSQNFRSLLFRTNSFPLVSTLVKTNPYPHASISVNHLMANIHSDTDFRPYVLGGGLQGVDVAFYSYRYLYHAPKDDIDHTSPESLQHMADNLYSSIVTLVYDQTLLKDLTVEPKSKDLFGDIPVPNYLYFDQLGILGVVITKNQFLALLSGLFIAIAVIVLVKSSTYLVWLGLSGVKRQVFLPIIGSILLIFLTFVVFVFLNLAISFSRSLLNPGFTYANPEVSLFSIIILCFAVISFMESAWPRLSRRFGIIRGTNSDHYYQALPTHGPAESDNRPDEIPPHEVEPTIGALPETTQVETTQVNIQIENVEDENQSSALDEDFPENFNEISTPIRKLDSQAKSLQYGLLVFWTMALLMALSNAAIFYLMFYWAFFSAIASGLTFFVEALYHKLIRQPTVHEPWQVQYVEIYQNYFWFIQLLVSTTVPLLLFADVVQRVVISLPSLVMEGLSDTAIDFLFSLLVWVACVNFMPLISKTCRKYSFTFFSIIYIALLVYQCLRFPYSPDRPFKYGLREVWDISNSTSRQTSNVLVTLGSTISPKDWTSFVSGVPENTDIYKNTISFDTDMLPSFKENDLIRIEESETLDGIYLKIQGKIVGSKGSRVCQLRFGEIPSYVSLALDEDSKWIEYGNATTATIDPSQPFTIYKKSFNHRDRISIPFKIISTTKFSIPLEVKCSHEVGDSNFRAYLDSIAPSWNSESLGSSLAIKKSHLFE
ncbi:hypothetical protein HDV04_004798 [Boothiomyces sp. JEL0838]|nr:hypothetical protein HDV04_004798 [Boothiomyces sp. JEL0838]